VTPETGATKVAVAGFSLHYGSFHALKSVTLDVSARRITSIIGPSGCGKSTLLRALNRMNDVIPGVRTSGSITLDGEDIYAPGYSVVGLRKRVGMVFQRPNPFPLSIRENVIFGPRAHGVRNRAELDAIVERSLRGARLWDEVSRNLDGMATELSLGAQQRLCVARVLAVQPDVILLDEPCSALDPAATLAIEDLMREMCERYTCVIVTHNMQQAARASHEAVFMLLGEMIEHGATHQVFTNPRDKRTEQYITGQFG
jgi:phosphate transport system ATP-binding protein